MVKPLGVKVVEEPTKSVHFVIVQNRTNLNKPQLSSRHGEKVQMKGKQICMNKMLMLNDLVRVRLYFREAKATPLPDSFIENLNKCTTLSSDKDQRNIAFAFAIS